MTGPARVSFCRPANYVASYAIHPATYLPIDSSPLLWSSLNWQGGCPPPPPIHTTPISEAKQVESMKSFNVSPDINIVFTALWDISTLASFLWRRWWKDHGPGQKLPPSISSRTVRDQKVKCPPHQNIPLREQIEGKNVRDVKWTATVWFLNCILLWFSKRYC